MQTYRVLVRAWRRLVTPDIARRLLVKAPFLDQHHRHLAEANLVIVQIRARIEHQRRIVATLDADEDSASKAKDVQTRMENTLKHMIRGRAFVLEDLKRAAFDFNQPEWLRARAMELRGIAADIKTGGSKAAYAHTCGIIRSACQTRKGSACRPTSAFGLWISLVSCRI